MAAITLSPVGPRVLIVDDHPSFRASARVLLEAEGFDVVGEAADGAQAITEAGRLRPEVVLLDVQLPDIDGFDVAARLTGADDAPTVILVSSRDGSDFGPLVTRSGARGFVPKAELSGRPRPRAALAADAPARAQLSACTRTSSTLLDDSLRVVVADDSVLLREGLCRLLEESGFDVVGQAGDAEDLMRKVGAHKPDVAVVDVRMPPTHTDEGLRAAHRIRSEQPNTAVLVLSQYVEEAYALDLLSESTERTGYLLKDRVSDVDTFTDAVRRVANGGSALDPEVVALLLGRRRREDPLESLTAREREVLGLMAEGRSNNAIAEALVVTERAVEKHVTSIFSKLDLPPTVEDHRRVLAVLAYLRAA